MDVVDVVRNRSFLVAFAALCLVASPGLAQVNHGDFIGTGVDFRDVTETTQSAGDPAVLWGAPSLGGTGGQLQFFPTVFESNCTPGIGTDTTSSLLTTDIEAQAGVNIETVALVETGDVILIQSPPFGDPSTNGSIAMSGKVTVTETTSGPIMPVEIPFTGTFTPTDTFALPTNFGSSSWSGSMSVDVASVVPLATKVTLESRKSTPYEIGLGWTVKLDREPFVGQAALHAEKQDGSVWQLVGWGPTGSSDDGIHRNSIQMHRRGR